ncbi:Transcription initiation factor TFIID subunit 12 [Spiromyces aspiralis]|uniref:Transcription initiation factor TFIID subunit 12 n=1 Tax=Spiromyces aspiralis TaxID=68401 RepID=A0ACC1HEI0_9FUNG|nr:Transcription initiation factor TFIID subunit 12 [Spiromyces aspiralis]
MLVDHLRSSLKQIQVRATQLHGWGQQPTLPATDRAKMLNQANRLDEYFTRAVSEISAIQKEMIESGSEDMFSGPRWVSFFNGEASSTIATGVSAGSGVPSSTGLGEAGLHSASPGIKGRPISSLGGASRIPGQSGLLSPTGIGAGGPSGSAGHAPPVTPVSLGSAISHMASQFSRHNAASMTLDGAGAGAGTAVTSGGATGVANGAGSGSGARVLSKRKIQELVGEIDPNERLEPEVEDILCDIADEFIESVTSFACQLAKHRKSNVLEAKDVQLHLERNWNIRIPGFSADEIRSVRKATLPASHQQRMQAINMMKNVKKFD